MNVKDIIDEYLVDKGYDGLIRGRLVRDIIKNKLKEKGYEGLVSPDRECWCTIDDLFCCLLDGIEYCKPAYKHFCNTCQYKGCRDDYTEYCLQGDKKLME